MLTVIGYGFLAIMAFVVIAVLWDIFYATPKEIQQERTKPIVCVCEEQGRIGVVLRKDYDAASKAEWQPYIDGKKRHDHGHVSAPFGRRLMVDPIFVFSRLTTDEYFTLMYHCFVERAEFHVPHIRNEDMNDLNTAWQYIFGKPFEGQLIKW